MEDLGLRALYRRVAGIDVHRMLHVVTVLIEQPDGSMQRQTREFGGFRRDCRALAAWLSELGVELVVMESTGICWKSVHAHLENAGIAAWVVNAHMIKHVPGRKTDMADSEWLAVLARFGLVRASFIPPKDLRELRLVSRYRRKLSEPVREFTSFTVDLNAIADWLQACGVDTVAMESTGVYWIPLLELLESRGFTVFLVNARHVKNVSGRKSDVLDCQWLQQLMTYGLLSAAFRSAEQVCVLRALARQREMLLKAQARHVQHMQKALTQMNIQLANVISDVVGVTGQKILRAIVAGQRDGLVLAACKDVRIHASADDIAKSLQGNWRAEHVFALKQALALFDFIGTQLAECDREIEAQLHVLQAHDGEPAKGKKRSQARNAPKFELRTQLFRMCGVHLTRIDGIDVTTALVVVSGVGADMSRFTTVKHFTSWLGLCSGTKITGGKVMSGKTKRCVNRASQALRLAAAALRSSKSALGAYYRRMCSRMDKPKAVTAVAHKLARLIYTMLTRGQEYTDQGQDYYEERYRERVLRSLSQRAAKLGLKMVPIEQPA